MAEEADQNKTEEPTPRRRERAREEGDVVFSPDLTAGALLLLLACALFLFGKPFSAAFTLPLEEACSQLRRIDWGVAETVAAGQWFLSRAMGTAGIVAAISIMIVLAMTQVQSGFTFTFQPVAPNWEKLSLAKGWHRLMSVDSFFRAGLACVKLASSIFVAFVFIWAYLPQVRVLAGVMAQRAISSGGKLLVLLMLALSGVTFVWGVIDYFFRRFRSEQKLKMTKQEIKDEQKDDQGDPQIRARIRRAQMESIQRRALTEVPRATMVITNPTHYAVALKYESGRMNAPVVLAKGSDLFARRIAAVARENGIPVFERKPLTRAIYALADIGDEIPVEFYRAIAELLAQVYRIKNAA